LAIIDEAHRLRNVYKTSNKIGRSIKGSLDKNRKILLTATPLQNSLLELYGLVSIIDDYAFGDLKSFKAQYARLTDEVNFERLRNRLAPICKRTLRSEVMEYINYTKRIAICERFTPYEDEQELYQLVSAYLQRDNLFALPPSQKQLMTLIMRKLLASSSFAIQGTLKGLAEKLEAIVNQQESFLEEVLSSEFESFDELKEEWTENEDEGSFEIIAPEQLVEIKNEIDDLLRFYEIASRISRNSKGDKLITALDKGFDRLKTLGAAQKAVIFTESTRTQNYLKDILEANGYQDKLVLFNGSNNDPLSQRIYQEWKEKHKGTDRVTGSRTADLRQALVDYFRNEATIMIATEAAAEGINLQFCSLLVNFDMPWNPQRIEQRIGRCHRYGQKFDVVVVNFLNVANEADVRVYQLLDQKFKLFDGVFGASDEVLGSIESGVDFEKRIAQIYNACRNPEALLSIRSFEEEEHILLAGFTDSGETLDQEICRRFFEVFAEEGKTVSVPATVIGKLNELTYSLKQDIIQDNMARNSQYFQDEIDKVDQWADDRKLSLEKEIKDIEEEIKLRKGEARKLLDLKRKVDEQRIIKELERKRSEKRLHLYEAQNEVEREKDSILDSYTGKLEQKISEDIKFTINWRMI